MRESIRRHYYFVYRYTDPALIDFKCPTGGVSVTGCDKLVVIRDAYLKARSRFPCRPTEVLVINEVRDEQRCEQVRMLERDWERSFADFHKLMTVN